MATVALSDCFKRGEANGQDGTNSCNGRNGGFATGPGSEANGANVQNGGVAVDVGSDANGGGVALNGGNTNGMSSGSNKNYVIIEYSV